MLFKRLGVFCIGIACLFSTKGEAFLTTMQTNSETDINDQGDQVAVWAEMGEFNFVVKFSYRLSTDSGWREPVQISVNGQGEEVGYPEVMINNDNKVVALWQQFQDDQRVWAIESAYYTLGDPAWSTPQIISTNTAADARFPDMAMDEEGNCFAAWVGVQEAELQYATFTDSTKTWSTPLAFDSSSSASSYPDVVVNEHGQVVVSWAAEVGPFDQLIQAVRGQINGSWGSVENLSNTGTVASMPEVALNNEGQALLSWQAGVDTGISVQAVFLPSFEGSWSPITTLSEIGGNGTNPQAVLNDAGDGLVVWQQMVGESGYVVQAALFSQITGWGSVNTISDPTTVATNPQAAYDNHGNIFAVWQAQVGNNSYIQYNTYNIATQEWGSNSSSLPGNPQGYYVQLQVNKVGEGIAAWQIDPSILKTQDYVAFFNSGSWSTSVPIPQVAKK